MLHLHRAARADALVDALRDLLAAPLDDPFAAEVVAVPTRGIERWLAQPLSTGLGATDGRRDGVCANVDFPSPRSARRRGRGRRLGHRPRRATAGCPSRLVWPLLEVVDEALAEPWLAALAAHLGGAAPAGGFGAVRHLADLYDRYALHRPEMVRGWAAGRRRRRRRRWQAELWRRLRARSRAAQPGRAARRRPCARLRDEPELVDLPDGSRCSASPACRPAHLAGAGRAGRRTATSTSSSCTRRRRCGTRRRRGARGGRRGRAPGRRPDRDPAAATGCSPRGAGTRASCRSCSAPGEHVDRPPSRREPPSATLLGRIQADVRARPRAAGARRRPAAARPDDTTAASRSTPATAAPARSRSCATPSCTCSRTTRPSSRATSSSCAPTSRRSRRSSRPPSARATPSRPRRTTRRTSRQPDLRVRLADRSLRQTNPVLGVVAQLLELAAGRAHRLARSSTWPTASRSAGASGSTTTTSPALEEWVAAAGIRWGLDAAHRAPFKLERLRRRHLAGRARPPAASASP